MRGTDRSESLEEDASAKRKGPVRRIAPLAVFLVLAGLAYGFGLHDYISFTALKQHRSMLLDFVAAHALLATLIYIVVYIVAIAASVPGGLFLSIIGGFLFGIMVASACTIVGATLGATLIFLIAKTVLGDALRAKAGPTLKKMEAGFRENAFNYLLVLRLVPLFPFWLVNLVPAFLGVELRTYVLATAIGIIPGTFVFVSVGTGLGSVLEKQDEFSLAGVLTPEVIIALCGLAVLALIPVGYRIYKERKAR